MGISTKLQGEGNSDGRLQLECNIHQQQQSRTIQLATIPAPVTSPLATTRPQHWQRCGRHTQIEHISQLLKRQESKRGEDSFLHRRPTTINFFHVVFLVLRWNRQAADDTSVVT
ncbi:uncharacterized protein LOC129249442 [Anastrepha obliqua]|uniref:uncharacterized protein LOC129249442 n=1 Tax=Anastrepha obliqua TaxID=95512 RepID=UPI00240A3814|nr:uncharacterized protein LOC129249442 [Anastrepha obliqua]XP_054745234.1 uncharacterized protein LOC129249442 [Anastrepha obliqua]